MEIKINKLIDHTLLRQDATRVRILNLCDEALQYDFASVCVNPAWIETVAKALQGSDVKACCVIAFPLGALTPTIKAAEAERVLALGAQEIDMVMNIGAVKSGDWTLAATDIAEVVRAVGGRGIVKVIIETCLLSDEEKIRACQLSRKLGADFVKTSTGFSVGGAFPEDVRLMRQTVGDGMGVKASGGISTYMDAVRLIEAGANRLGTSAGVKILEESRRQSP